MPGRVARVAPSSFYDDVSSGHETLPPAAETRVRVAVAATEALAEDAEHNRVMARVYRCRARMCSFVAVAGVAVLGFIFVNAWVQAFRKGKFADNLAFFSLLFFGSIVFAWAVLRRFAGASSLEEERFTEHLSKGVPRYVRQTYQYFIFPSSDAADDSGVASESGETTSSISPTASCHPRDEETKSLAETDALDAFDGGTTSLERGGIDAGRGSMALERAREAVGVRELSPRGQWGDGWLATAMETTTVVTPQQENCTVCLDAYDGGDRLCRLPCSHVFHATCIDTWLDQHHVCPHCRLDLLPAGDITWESGLGDQSGGQVGAMPTIFQPEEASFVPNPTPPSATSNAVIAEVSHATTYDSPAVATAHRLAFWSPDASSTVSTPTLIPAGLSPASAQDGEAHSTTGGTPTGPAPVTDATTSGATTIRHPPSALLPPLPERVVTVPRPTTAITPPENYRVYVPRPTKLPRPIAAATPSGEFRGRIPRPTATSTPPQKHRASSAWQTPSPRGIPTHRAVTAKTTADITPPRHRHLPNGLSGPFSVPASGMAQRRFSPKLTSTPRGRTTVDTYATSPDGASDIESADVINAITAANTLANARNSGRLAVTSSVGASVAARRQYTSATSPDGASDIESGNAIAIFTAANTFANARNSGRLAGTSAARVGTAARGQYASYLESPDAARPNATNHAFSHQEGIKYGTGMYAAYLDSPLTVSENVASAADSERWASAASSPSFLNDAENTSPYLCFSPDFGGEVKWDNGMAVGNAPSWETVPYAGLLDIPDDSRQDYDSVDYNCPEFKSPMLGSYRSPPPRHMMIPYQRSPVSGVPGAHYLDSSQTSSPLVAANVLNFRLAPELVHAAAEHRVSSLPQDIGDPSIENISVSSLQSRPSLHADGRFQIDAFALRDRMYCRGRVDDETASSSAARCSDETTLSGVRYATGRTQQQQQPMRQLHRRDQLSDFQYQSPQPLQEWGHSSPQEPRYTPPREPCLKQQLQQQHILDACVENCGMSSAPELTSPPPSLPRLAQRGGTLTKNMLLTPNNENVTVGRRHNDWAESLTTLGARRNAGSVFRSASTPWVLGVGDAALATHASGLNASISGPQGSRVRIEYVDAQGQDDVHQERNGEVGGCVSSSLMLRQDEVGTATRKHQPQTQQLAARKLMEIQPGLQRSEQLREHLRRMQGHYLPSFEEESATDEDQEYPLWNKVMYWFTPEAFRR